MLSNFNARARFLTLLVFGVTPSQGGSINQSGRVVTVSDNVTCGACRIELTPEHQFEPRATEGGRGGVPLQVLRWSGKQHVLRMVGEIPTVFSERGKLLRQIGRQGSGPGEFETVGDMSVLPGDSLLIMDSDLARASVFSPNLTFVRSISLPFSAYAIAVLEWPRIVAVNGMSYTSDQAGWPLHLLDFSTSPATRKTSFGDNEGVFEAGRDYALLRKTTGATAESFWAYHIVKYQLTRYSREGRVELIVRRQPSWFAKDSPWSRGGPNVPPPPMVQTAVVRNDTLWVSVGIPRADWRLAWGRFDTRGRTELSGTQRPSQSDLYMSRIEAIDLKSGTLVSQKDVDGVVVDIDDQMRVAVYDVSADLQPRLRLFTLSIKR